MPQVVQKLDASQCQLDSLRSGKHYLSCDLKGNRVSSLAQEIVTCSLPSECKGDPSLLGRDLCPYRCTDGTSRCSCAPMNDPQLRAFYKSSVVETVLEQAKGKEELNLTFFASGHLANEREVITAILGALDNEGWKGQLKLQFVDPVYGVNKTKAVLNPSRGYLGGAVVCGALGLGALAVGTQQSKKEHRYAYYIGCITFLVLATVLGVLAFSEPEEEKTLRNRQVDLLNLEKPSVRVAIEGMMRALEGNLPHGIKLKTDYFSHERECREKGRTADALFGYDIDNNLPDFESLKAGSLSPNGKALLVIKYVSDKPYVLRGSGPNRDLQWTPWMQKP